MRFDEIRHQFDAFGVIEDHDFHAAAADIGFRTLKILVFADYDPGDTVE
jgi:hypothetical protein